MKMAGHRGLIVLLTLQGVLLLRVRAQKTEVKSVIAVGSNVTMVPIYTGNPSEINWKINGNKLVDMELTPPRDLKFYRLQDRATINRSNGSLTIRGLTLEDAGLYIAEVLENNVYQYTDVTLTVRNCPAKPNITDRSTKDRIVLFCESSTLGVTYKWEINGISVGTNQLYNGSRPNEDVNLTCVVDNEACKNYTSKTIPYTPESSGPSRGFIGIIFGVIVVIAIVISVLLYIFRHRNSTDVAGQRFLTQSQQVKSVGSEVTMVPVYTGNPTEINWKKDGNKLVDMNRNPPDEPIFYRPQGRVAIDGTNGRLTIRGLTVEDSGVYQAEVLVKDDYQFTEIPLTVRESCVYITVKFPEDQPKGKVKPRLTIHNVKPEDHGQYVLEVLQSDGEKYAFDIKETDGIVIMVTEDDRVTLTVPNTEKVTKITLKKGGVTLFQWKVSDLKLHTNNITLGSGFVTVNNADGRGSYKVEVHSTNNRIANNTLQQEANNQGNESSTNREAELEMALLAGNGHPENQPMDSVTFHPINMTNKITWKKDGQLVKIDGKKMKSGPCGELTINNVTPGDEGKYTVQCEGQKLEQDFILHL